MHDPEFQQPVEKFSEPTVASFARDLPTCKLANVSLVFGILGIVPLPVLGSLIAIVTGHIALGEIRASEGRLGGRPAAKAGLILGYLGIALALLAVVIIFAIVGFATQTVPQMITQRHEAAGVKIANEMTSRDFDTIRNLKLHGQTVAGLEISADITDAEEIIAFYKEDGPEDGEAALAILTNQRIVYVKGDRFTTWPLTNVIAVLDDQAYMQKYMPNHIDTTRYMIELKNKSGGRMRIVIKPKSDGPLFSEALNDAWKAAGGKPETASKK